MAEIRPFRGVRYDLERVGGLDKILGPPEDIPSTEQAIALIKGRPYHSVRLEMPDASGGARFQGSAWRLREWLAQGVLVREPEPAFYVYEHEYPARGRRRRRRGFFAALKLTEAAAGQVLPHENVMPQNLGLRIALLRDVHANLSAVYTLIEDDGQVERVLDSVTDRVPDQEGADGEGGVHRLWVVRDERTGRALREAVAGRPLYIADGHHRYAAALEYRDELRARLGDAGPAEYILTHIADASDPGILILPIHRLIRTLDGIAWADARERLRQHFHVMGLSVPASGQAAVEARTDELGRSDTPWSYLVLEPGGRSMLSLRLRDWDASERLLPEGWSALTRRLDVSVADALIVDYALGIGPEAVERRVEFTADTGMAYREVRSGRADAAIFLRPTPLESLLAVARSGDRMPQKSTYFYPKIPIGLVIYDLQDSE